MSRRTAIAAALVPIVLVASCAVSVVTEPATFAPASGGEIELDRSTEVQLPTSYARMLSAGSRWRRIGAVQQGGVYQPVGTIFTIEGRNVHEAYLIISPSRMLVGFYLPGEIRSSLLPSPIQLSYKELQ